MELYRTIRDTWLLPNRLKFLPKNSVVEMVDNDLSEGKCCIRFNGFNFIVAKEDLKSIMKE